MTAVKQDWAKGNLRAHFLENTGRVMASDELREVAGTSEWMRFVRELRDEEGYQIFTHHDRDNLRPGEYFMEAGKPRPAFERGISKETRAFVLDHDDFACYMCGAVGGEPDPYDSTKTLRLRIGHIIDKSMGGTDEPSNLRALCSNCNEGSANATLMRPDLKKLLIEVRRATNGDQLEVLKWLLQKFPAQAKAIVDAQ